MDHPYRISDFAFSFRRREGTTRDLIEGSGDSSDRGSSHGKPERDREPNSARSNRGSDRLRTIYSGRDREHSLRESEVRALIDLGKFRVVSADDLARFGYDGDLSQMESDVRNLARHGLVEQQTIEGHSSFSTKVLTLTKDGHWLLERAQLVSHQQATYHGLVKPKEARHDADLYRLYQQVARDIEDSGGNVRRVVLDFELKKDLYQALSRMRPDKDPRYERIVIANQFDLKAVDGKIPIPNLRIEYEDDCREIRRLDLEVATRYYRPRGLGEKAKAGFHLFARQQDHAKLRRVLDTHRREDNRRVRFLTEEEEERLRKIVQEKWPTHLPELDLALNTGIRKGSQYGLTWDMVDWKSRELHIPRTKNEEPLHVPLNDAAIRALTTIFEIGDGNGRVFTSVKTGAPLENGRHWFDDAVTEAKIRNFRWHDLRHTFASRLRTKGTPLEDIADLLGHKSLTMTRRYAHLGPNKLHAVVSLLSATDTTTDTEEIAQAGGVAQVAVQ